MSTTSKSPSVALPDSRKRTPSPVYTLSPEYDPEASVPCADPQPDPKKLKQKAGDDVSDKKEDEHDESDEAHIQLESEMYGFLFCFTPLKTREHQVKYSPSGCRTCKQMYHAFSTDTLYLVLDAARDFVPEDKQNESDGGDSDSDSDDDDDKKSKISFFDVNRACFHQMCSTYYHARDASGDRDDIMPREYAPEDANKALARWNHCSLKGDYRGDKLEAATRQFNQVFPKPSK